MFNNMNYPNNYPGNPNGMNNGTVKAVLRLIGGMCIVGICALVLFILLGVIPALAEMIVDEILSFFRGVRFGRGVDGIVGLAMVLIFIVGIAKLISNHFRN